MVKASDKTTRAIVEAANEWLLVMHEASVSQSDEQAFAAWLRESPVHVREYLKAETLFASLEGIDAEKRIDVEALLATADDAVVELGVRDDSSPESGAIGVAVPPAETAEGGRPQHRRPVFWATAASVLLAVVLAVWYSSLPQAAVYTTGLGEQRRLVLDDGSVVDMNTQSKLAVRLGQTLRSIELVEGEALFTVARDPERPFVVASEQATVRALGTQFNVQQRNGEVLVTVLEGRVSVEHVPRADGSATTATVGEAPVELGAGEAAEMLPSSTIRTLANVNTEHAVAWTERRLIFENEALSAVVAEFNRYNPRQLVIDDATLGEERISAVFDADKPGALIRFLEQNAGVVVTESQTQWLIRAAE